MHGETVKIILDTYKNYHGLMQKSKSVHAVISLLLIRVFEIYRRFVSLMPGSVVGIATAYGLDGPGIESRWRRDFPHQSRPVLRPTQPPVQWVPGLSLGVRCGRGVTLTPQPLLVPRSKLE